MDMELVPVIIFVSVVLPLWLVFHYITKWKKDKGISPQDESLLRDLRGLAEKLESRVQAMERILDDEVPEWRQRINDPL